MILPIRRVFTFFFFLVGSSISFSQSCLIKNTAFKSGEELKYIVNYSWGLIWVEAGHATFTVKSERIGSLPVYHFIGEGSSFPKYDWFYKVRDKFESYSDSLELKPFRYIRNTSEGGNKVYNDNLFNFRKLKVYSNSVEKDNRIKRDSIQVDICTKDVLTMIYYARNLDFSKCKPDEKIPVSLFLDGKVYPLYIRYVGKEKVKTEFGTLDCIKFRPLLIEGTIFKGGDEMTVWVTDDKRRIPVYIETPIVVGSIKVRLVSIKNTQ